MNTVCAKAGCPNLIEAGPQRIYCAAHDALNANLAGDYEEEAHGVLDETIADARVGLELDGFEKHVAEQITLYGPAVEDAAERGDLWTAIRHALWVGYMKGLWSSTPERRTADHQREIAKAQRNWGREGGRPLKEFGGVPAPAVEDLRAAFDRYFSEERSKLRAALRAGKDFGGIPPRTVLGRIGEKS